MKWVRENTEIKEMANEEPTSARIEQARLFLRPAEAAKMLGVSDRMARFLMSKGYIKSRLVGSELRTSLKAVERFAEQLFDETDPLAKEAITGKHYGTTLEISNLISITTNKGGR